MSRVMAENEENSFKWGVKVDGCTPDNAKLYRSFIYQGVEYSLFDCVYMFREGAKETDIGKLVKMWETKNREKRGKILWFFRPVDIRHFLGDYEPSWNELFLACGAGKGLSNIIPLEALIGKCNVICTSKDRRNVLLSKSDLGKAEYFFSHVFDVGNLTMSEKFPDKIDMVKVERLFNRSKAKPKANAECKIDVTAGAKIRDSARPLHIAGKDCQVGTTDTKVNLKDFVKEETWRKTEDLEQHRSDSQPFKKRKIQPSSQAASGHLLQPKVEDTVNILDPLITNSTITLKKEPSAISTTNEIGAVVDKEASKPVKVIADEFDEKTPEISQSRTVDKRRWFLTLPWEDRVKEAHDHRTLVFFYNLDPSYTSSDVEEMILTAFKIKADTKIIPCGSFSSRSYGQALAIFETEHDADFVISELKEKCLMVGEGRPVVAHRTALREPGKHCRFPGHLIEKLKKIKRRGDKENDAVSTSHCSQSNTIEHDMATQWRMLQARSDLWWKALHETQAKEVSKCLNQLKSRQSSEHTSAKEASSGACSSSR